MKELITIEQALRLNVEKFAALPDEQRAAWLAWVRDAAAMHGDAHTRQFNAALLPMLKEADRQIQREKVPTMPTAQEHIQFWGGLASGLAVFALKIGGAFCAVYLVYGMIDGGVRWFRLNGWIVGGALGLLFVLFVLSGLFGSKGEKEEKEPGEVSAKNQTIIVNVFTSQNGDVNVNS